ncbi:MAG: ASKHA domain-containing protein [Thermodesulfovibrionales bacterium]|nr:ASKHA domain-containing protein [Thermodesulfovibrionales bacterium]
MDIKLTTGKSLSAAKGESILNTLKRHEIYLTASCGGKGTCGKCKVRLIEGAAGVASYGKLTEAERKAAITLACQTYPKENILMEIPEGSRLVVGDKIALGRSKDLFELLLSFKAEIKPVVKRLGLKLPQPTIEDHISDLERLKRALEQKGIKDMRFSHRFSSSLSATLRSAGWDILIAYAEPVPGAPEAIFITASDIKDRYGIAVDIGTTTIVLYLIDLAHGRLVDVGSTYNSQIRYGDDVITRIIYASEGGGLEDLRDAVVTDIENLLAAIVEKHGLDRDYIESAVISGNTTMAHLYWGLDPGHIREEPYIPAVNFFPMWRAGTARLGINPQAPVCTMPAVASYVGGDIVSGVLASGMNRSEEVALFMDIGTNGEIAVGGSEWLLTAACSAGPCFEGSGIKHGMRATEGAIEAVSIEPGSMRPIIRVIGGGVPSGICGSGMIDAVSEMFLKGIIDRGGKLLGDAVPQDEAWRMRDTEEGPEFVLYKGEAGGRDITLTGADIENILRAKAAIYAGVSLLLREVGLTQASVKKVYIAGGFGNYLDVKKAIILGMLPDMPLEKFSFIGNASITGAYLCLLSEGMREEAMEIANKMTYVELSVSSGFMDEYMSALFLPHTDISKFPSVEGMMKEGAR